MSLEETINNWYNNVSDEALEAIDQLLEDEDDTIIIPILVSKEEKEWDKDS